jgi:hypothetical protein
MSFASNTGYVPNTVESLMNIVRENVNAQFLTAYTPETFVGTNFYKYFYALIQKLQENEVKTSEIFLKLQEYFRVTNDRILRPNTTAPGIVDYFKAKGFLVSVKPPQDADAGKLFICVDVDETADDYEATKLALCGYVKDCCVAGVISQGTEEEEITLANLQAFTFKYNLPTRTPVLLKLTITQSQNNQFVIQSPDWIVERLLNNLGEKYRLGMNFEPQKYFSVIDAPWAASILLEWSTDEGETWSSSVYASEYDEVFTFGPDSVSLVEV